MTRERSFVPALGFHRLTALYDPLIQNWSGMAKLRASMIDALELRAGMRILELGAGSGRLAIEIKRRHPEVEIEAVDVDHSMVSRAKRNATQARVDISVRAADITCLPELGSFDRVYSTMVFHHLMPCAKQEALATAGRVLRPDGRFVVGDFGRPRDMMQWALFSWIQQPLDGYRNTSPHRDGRYEQAVRDAFAFVDSAAVLRTAAGTIEVFVCRP
jgi:ubiquinone/menaquinone biosynthesis C-methylase UbiE